MITQRTVSATVSYGQFIASVAHDVVRMAAASEGLDNWLKRHSGSLSMPGKATRNYAQVLFGDTMDAVLFNSLLVLQVETIKRRGLAR